MDAVTRLESDVRDAVRRAGIDPLAAPEAVRSVVHDALRQHDRDAMRGAIAPIDDPDGAVGLVMDAIAGFGPLQPHLDDPEVEEIWINEPGRVFVARHGRSELTTTVLEPHQVRELVERMLRPSGRRLDLSTPFVDAMLPDGSRLHVVIPDVTREHWAVNIRKFVARAHHLDDLVELGTLTHHAATFLSAAVQAGLNIVVAGATQAGKTTLLNCLLAAVPARERVVSCEEVFELQPPLVDWVALQTRQTSLEGTGEIPLRRLIKEALRMRPDRLVIGEVRQAEALDMLIALNSGLPGMCSVHANTAREAVLKLCTLPLLAGENVGSAFVVPTVASSIDIVVHTAKRRDGSRRVREVVALPGRVEDGVVEVADIFTTRDDELVRAGGYPPHADRFAQANLDLAAILDDRRHVA